jgi:hypothetical protein
LGEFFGKKLQRHMTAEIQVFSFIHHPHAATTDLAQNAVMPDLGLGQPGFWI